MLRSLSAPERAAASDNASGALAARSESGNSADHKRQNASIIRPALCTWGGGFLVLIIMTIGRSLAGNGCIRGLGIRQARAARNARLPQRPGNLGGKGVPPGWLYRQIESTIESRRSVDTPGHRRGALAWPALRRGGGRCHLQDAELV